MIITPALLRGFLWKVEEERLPEQTRIVNAACLNFTDELLKADILSAKQLALFFGLVAYDSEQFSRLAEPPQWEAGPPEMYRPRGLLKISGRENYERFGEHLGIELERMPDRVSEPTTAVRLAISIWLVNYEGRLDFRDLDGVAIEFAARGRQFDKERFLKCFVRSAAAFHFTDPDLPPLIASHSRSISNGSTITVWYGTNREPKVNEIGFSAARSDALHFGQCSVFIPQSHKIGSVGSPFFKRLLRSDDRLRVDEIRSLDKPLFWTSLQEAFKASQDTKSAIVFIHGYNVTFEGAAVRAAQIAYDLSAQTAMAFFSWPSQGRLADYLTDEATIEVSEAAITEFLVQFVAQSGAERIHLMAHSMGNRGLLRALSRIAASAKARGPKQFAQIILAAADLDADLFRQHARAYTQLSERTSLYVSPRDRAVEFSHWLHRFPRVGIAPPTLVLDGVDTINVSDVDISMLGHGYFAEARGILADLHQLIAYGASPSRRFGLREVSSGDGKAFWQLRP